MHKLGISIYPEHSNEASDFAYMELAAKYGFTRIFTCLLSVKEPKEVIIEKFSRFIAKAHALGFEVSVDTNPLVFAHLGASAFDVSVFAQMQVDIIRLDLHFSDMEDLAIIKNPYGIKIEFNGSFPADMEGLMKRGVKRDQVMICHNFFPQRYTGLSWEKFMEFNKTWYDLGLHTAAFVSSNQPDTVGPWPVAAGLPTCEVHRNLPIDIQMRHLLACGMVDDVIIGNAFASEEELKCMAEVLASETILKVEEAADLTKAEKEILYDFLHEGRADASAYMLRSYFTRTIYRDKEIPVRKHKDTYFHRGDICIVNDNLPYYRGELQLILCDLPNDGERNLIARLAPQELLILDEIQPEQKFRFLSNQ